MQTLTDVLAMEPTTHQHQAAQEAHTNIFSGEARLLTVGRAAITSATKDSDAETFLFATRQLNGE
jgi:hypothetical protein